MKVMGLDLSLASTGGANIDGTPYRLLTSSKGIHRLWWFREQIRQLAEAPGRPDVVIVEGYSMGTARQSSHAHALGELGGVVRLALRDAEIPFVDVPPASLKKYATGKGNANKELVLVEAVKRLGYEGSSNDEADALWLRAMGLDAYGAPVVQMPAKNREAIGAVVWPTLGEQVACSG